MSIRVNPWTIQKSEDATAHEAQWDQNDIIAETGNPGLFALPQSQGNARASAKRLNVIEDIPSLGIDDKTIELAETLFAELSIPEKAKDDALNIAVACVHEMDYLLSWNFKHIVNASAIRRLRGIVEHTNYRLPQICTPEELFQ